MSYPPPPGQDPNNPYAQQPPQQPQQPYGYPQQQQQQPQQPPAGGQPAYGYPQQQNPYAQQPPGTVPGQPAYGYPQQATYGYSTMPPAYANWLHRVGATLLDALIVGVPYGVLVGIAAGAGQNSSVSAILALLGLLVLIGLGLWLIYQEGTTGQTPGKRVVGIRLLGEDSAQPIGFGMAFARRLAHILDSLACYLGWFWPLWDTKRQTFADKVCRTLVVRSQ